MDRLEIFHANQTSMCFIQIRVKGEVGTMEYV